MEQKTGQVEQARPAAAKDDEIPALLTQEQAGKVVAELDRRKATNPCPRCGHKTYTLSSGIVMLPFQSPQAAPSVLAPQVLPCASVSCDNCGFLALHGLGALGFLSGGKVQM